MKKIVFIGLVIILLLSLISCGPKISYPMIKNIEIIEENTGVLFNFKYDIRYKIPDENLKLKISNDDESKIITGIPNSDKTEYTFKATNINPGTQLKRKFFINEGIINGSWEGNYQTEGNFKTKSESDNVEPIILSNNYSLEETGKMASSLTLEIDETPAGVKEALIKLTRIDEYGKFEEPRTIYLENELMTFTWKTKNNISSYLTDPIPGKWNYYIKIVDNSGNTTITDIGTLTYIK